jgi:glutamate/aspartate transport system substrate-binding protein
MAQGKWPLADRARNGSFGWKKAVNMTIMKWTLPSLLAACLLFAGGTAQAQGLGTPSGTLEKISQYGAVYVGHRESSIPFSYLDADGKVIGYSWELCQRVTDAIKARLNRPDLAVVPVPVTSSSRQMMLEAGTIDLECGSTSNTDQRQRYVGFAVTTFVAGVKALVKKDSGVRSVKDMKGRTVVTTSGTTSDAYIKAAAVRQGVFPNYRVGRDHAESLRQLLRGEADVMVLDDILLQGLLMNVPESDKLRLVVLEENYANEPYAIMLRRNDPEFKKLVDDTLIALMKNGELARVYAKWFTSPIPPAGGNLNLPMGDLLKQLILTPNGMGI